MKLRRPVSIRISIQASTGSIIGTTNYENRDRGPTNDPLSHTAKDDSIDSCSAVSPQDHQIDPVIGDVIQYRFVRISVGDFRDDRHT